MSQVESKILSLRIFTATAQIILVILIFFGEHATSIRTIREEIRDINPPDPITYMKRYFYEITHECPSRNVSLLLYDIRRALRDTSCLTPDAQRSRDYVPQFMAFRAIFAGADAATRGHGGRFQTWLLVVNIGLGLLLCGLIVFGGEGGSFWVFVGPILAFALSGIAVWLLSYVVYGVSILVDAIAAVAATMLVLLILCDRLIELSTKWGPAHKGE